MIEFIKAKKDLYNNGLCFTKGKIYAVTPSVSTLAGLMERQVINNLGEKHQIGSWWKDFNECSRLEYLNSTKDF